MNNLQVIAVTWDGATPNRKLFQMNFPMTDADNMNPEVDVTYRTINLLRKE